ncbi:MAG: hypothetical protein OEV95_07850 [Gemmatimonadota bacterium]|nr:hypothetical protein [Gemmatimonadota bacterium]MDH5284121.1 hypothetical protein [Gemmatimonadota bacterium]
MSRAFVREDRDDTPARFDLPAPSSPDFDRAAAWALLEGANRGDSLAAESATGYKWGDPRLRDHVEAIREHAHHRGESRLEQLAERYLRSVGEER